MIGARYLFAALLVPLVACGGEDPASSNEPTPDASSDVGIDVIASDGSADATADASQDAGAEAAGMDSSADAADVGPDSEVGADANVDADVDGGGGNGLSCPDMPSWPSTEIGSGFAPKPLVLAELGSDGALDVVAARPSGALVVLLGNGSAGFGSPSELPLAAAPRHIAVGDLDGDGLADWVVANAATTSVIRNLTAPAASSASFGAKLDLDSGPNTITVALADFNADTRLDIAALSADAKQVAIFLNTTPVGSATLSFAPKLELPIATFPNWMVGTDVNADGRTDLVVSTAGDTIILLDTTPPGATTASFSSSSFPQDGNAFPYSHEFIVAGDFDANGSSDLMLASQARGGRLRPIVNQTAPGATTPKLVAADRIPASGFPSWLALSDVNADTHPDLVTANSGGIAILLNTPAAAGKRTFLTVTNLATSAEPSAVECGDIDANGSPDIVTTDVAGKLRVLQNPLVAGSSIASFRLPATFKGPDLNNSLVIADFDGDGQSDVESGGSIFLNQTSSAGTVAFSPAAAAGGGSLTGDAIGDFDADGKPDIVTATGGTYTGAGIWRNSTPANATSATFDAPVTFGSISNGIGPGAIAVGDVNGDGRHDIATSNKSPDHIGVLLNATPSGSSALAFEPIALFAAPAPVYRLALGDLNADGRDELVVPQLELHAPLQVWLNTTPAGASTPTFVADNVLADDGEFGAFTAAIGDLDGDGMPEVVSSRGTAIAVFQNQTAPGAQAIALGPRFDHPTGWSVHGIVILDLNHDGRPDIAVANAASDSVSILFNTTPPGVATPSFAPRQDFQAGREPYDVAAADFDSDGLPDLVANPRVDDSVGIFLRGCVPGL